MKKLTMLLLLIVLAVYAMGRWSLSESGVTAYLAEWEQQTVHGDASGMCATFADDARISITDHTMERGFTLEGGKQEFCDYLDKALPLMSKALTSMNVVRDEFTVKHRPWHWWTADVSYTEHRRMGLIGGLELKTVGEDRLVLARSFSGLRLERLEAETWKE